MNFSTGCDDAVREAITQSGINNGASTHICVRKTDLDWEISNKLKQYTCMRILKIKCLVPLTIDHFPWHMLRN